MTVSFNDDELTKDVYGVRIVKLQRMLVAFFLVCFSIFVRFYILSIFRRNPTHCRLPIAIDMCVCVCVCVSVCVCVYAAFVDARKTV